MATPQTTPHSTEKQRPLMGYLMWQERIIQLVSHVLGCDRLGAESVVMAQAATLANCWTGGDCAESSAKKIIRAGGRGDLSTLDDQMAAAANEIDE